MKNYILREQAEKLLAIMDNFPDHDAFLLDIDSSSGIGTNINLTVDIIYNGVAGKFIMPVTGPESW